MKEKEEPKKESKPHIIIVCGQTATGKSDLAVFLAKKHRGEIISCDSRQVYTGLDYGSNKIPSKDMQSIPHYGLDIAPLGSYYTVFDFQKYAREKIREILERRQNVILCGGTGLFIDAVLFDHYTFGGEKKSLPFSEWHYYPGVSHCTITWIGLHSTRTQLGSRIHARAKKNLHLIQKEIADLITERKVDSKWIESLGLEYTFGIKLYRKEIIEKEYIEMITLKTIQYAKRQMTWFRRNQAIHWIEV